MPLDSPDTQGVPLHKSLAAALESSGAIRGCLKETTLENFNGFGLAAPLVTALTQMGYSKPTPIQAQAIPALMQGRDLIGIAQTGTGKTAAFALPILNHLLSHPRSAPQGGARVLVLSPTRELASQIAQSFRDLSAGLPFSIAVVFGGVPHGAQIKALARGPRRARRDARPSRRPPRCARRASQRHRVFRARRGRPDARSRFRQIDPPRRARSAQEAAESVLLRDHANRHPQAGGRIAA